MLKKLRAKFVCINMLIVTILLLVIFAVVFQTTKQNLASESLRMMQAIAMDPSEPGRPGQSQEEVRLPYFALQISWTGELIVANGGNFDLSDQEFLQQVIDVTLNSQEESGVLEDYHLRFCRVTTPRSQCIVFADMSSEQSTLKSLIQTCIIIGIISFLALFLISLFFARWAIRPVDRAWTQQRQFVADASHELKTPLTVILTNAELLQDSAYEPAAREKFAGNILTMAKQMRGLVENLLELARVDNGSINGTMERLNFSELISDAVLPFEPLYFERQLELTCHLEEAIAVKGSVSHLKQVVEILLDNALKYSAAPANVHVSLQRRGLHCLLCVANPGDPISEADLKNIFKRFYRTDKVRSMNHSYGLGLSIAQSIVQEHHGKIWAQSNGGWNSFFVELPALQ